MLRRLYVFIASLAIGAGCLAVVANDSYPAVATSPEETDKQLDYAVKLGYLCQLQLSAKLISVAKVMQ